jgi:hypothetical protein
MVFKQTGMKTEGLPPEIRIKFLSKTKPGHDGDDWWRMFPGRDPVWGNCRFIFDRHCREYDWLVVYDELPSVTGERRTLWREELACPPEHTLLMTVEPSTIKTYGTPYLKQFRWVLTSQEAWAVGNHPGRIFDQPALIWFYSNKSPRGDYDTLVSTPPLDKLLDVSTVCSSKSQGHTLHNRRYEFTVSLKERFPELDIYGHGIRYLEEKADALDKYRYHVAIENFSGRHHWTEKLADAFLGCCLPFYYGCPDVFDYFPEESLVRIDMASVEATADMLRKAIRDNYFKKRLPHILKARQLVLERYGPIATISRIVSERHDPSLAPEQGVSLASRHLLKRNPLVGARFLLEKLKVRSRHSMGS